LQFKTAWNKEIEMIWARHFKLLTKLGVAALALGALTTTTNAQNAYQGKFTLAVQTHWGGVTLPAGDYTFTLPSNSAPYRFYIQGQGIAAIVTAASVEDRVLSASPQLNLVDTEDGSAIQAFEAPQLGEVFIYWATTQKHPSRKEARQKALPNAVPNTATASQASESKTSIQVHSTGH
jgi:hypothetical protein